MNKNQDITVDFLGIGVQKSASSWLWRLLKEHDAIWMPPRKELHYFDRSLLYPSPSFLASDKLKDRLNGQEAHNILFRQKVINELDTLNDNEKITWYKKYFLEPTYNDEWYKSLFEQGYGKIKGEITPAYSILNKEDIRHIKALFPHLKIILILRNPIDRAWSQLRFYITRNMFTINNDMDKIKAFIDSEIQETRGDYIQMLNNWTSIFPEEQIFIGFYDEIMESSKSFIGKISSFLEIDKEPLLSSSLLKQKINVSVEMKMPEEIKAYLVEKYIGDIEKMVDIFDVYPRRWLENSMKLN
ncbi:MAG: Unknown protein [uncultured Sulfurovum sp.]|uniref:Sulfotransferase n=1 Tax=uncultured Sulfurovum sp. TaxID=269237 RepID=A0A6S6TJ88_9BACT|nr:MAG: Unknown protein [uncultured Sulfurovum sp.]